MGFPDQLLDENETVELHLHPHWRVLVLPALLVPVTVGVGSYLATLPSGSSARWIRLAVLVAALLVVLAGSVRPWLRWITTRYVVTTRRVLIRTGILSRFGRDVPLARITDVSFSHTLVERIFGSGTLIVESAGERGEISLSDVPRVEQVQRTLYGLVEDDDQRRAARGGGGAHGES